MPFANKVTVCIPTYNHARYLAAAIESVLAQTFGDFELIVVDNASTDNTRDLMLGYLARDPRVRYFCNPRNLGMVGNWNKCLEYATGEYVKVLCSDDALEPECLERAVAILDRNASVGLVTCARQVVDESLRPLQVLKFAEGSGVWSGREAIKRSLEKINPIGEPTAVVFRRDLAQRGFNPAVNQLADIEMWLQMLQHSSLYFDAVPLCLFRVHPGQCTEANLKNLQTIDEEFAILEDFQGFLRENFTAAYIGKIRFLKALNAWRFLKRGHPQDAVCARIEQHYGLARFRLLYPFRSLIKRI